MRILQDNISVAYLVYKMLKNIGEDRRLRRNTTIRSDHWKQHGTLSDAISAIFRENLKVGTPWVVKIVNMEFLLEHALSDRLKEQTFYLASHFSNLVKVSERVTVRHKAGRGLIEIAQGRFL